jgi:hypothetical protein
MAIFVEAEPIKSTDPTERPFLEPSDTETKRWIEEVFYLYVDEQ